jgi:hypothetical protein
MFDWLFGYESHESPNVDALTDMGRSFRAASGDEGLSQGDQNNYHDALHFYFGKGTDYEGENFLVGVEDAAMDRGFSPQRSAPFEDSYIDGFNAAMERKSTDPFFRETFCR